MSDTYYTVEKAKSGRAKCKKCKEPIAKDAVRIGLHMEKSDGMNICNWYHPECFTLPRKLAAGPNKMTVEEFVADMLRDTTGGCILPAMAEEIVAKISSKPAKKEGKAASESNSRLAEMRATYEKRQRDTNGGDDKNDGEEEQPPPSKKKRKTAEDDAVVADMYEKYHKMTGSALDDILGYNRQVKSGKKDDKLTKVIDGAVYGRLARCGLCEGGRLKLDLENLSRVICSGSFDEDTQQRIVCKFACTVAEAPRYQPWYDSAPTAEEEEEMDRLEAEAKGETSKGDKAAGADDADIGQLIEAVENCGEWPESLTSKKAIRAACAAVVKVLLNHGGKKVDVGSNQEDAMRKVGPVVISNRDKATPSELIPIIVKEFGFKEDKERKAAKKEAKIEQMVKVSANAPLVAAFGELAQLYFKEGNRNAGSTYVKVANVLKDLDVEVTEDNAKSFGKNKDVKGIGKGSADKMYEFVTTGTMEKLEQKRQDAA